MYQISISALFLLNLISSLIGFYYYIKLNKKYFHNKEQIKNFLTHHQNKNNTPNKGGIVMFIIFSINMLYLKEFFILFISFLGFTIGLIDDLLKKNKGLNNYIRIITWTTIGLLVAWKSYVNFGGIIYVPLLNISLNLKVFYIFFISIFLFLGGINGVNMTDGLDGLVSFPLISNFIFLFIVSLIKKDLQMLSILVSITGILLGFLYFNISKAKVFMSDCGAIFLGVLLSTLYTLLKVECYFLIVGGIFAINVISSFLQVISIKFFKKKIFKMAPLHHHFELLGFQENTIVFYVWWWSIILLILGLFFFK